MNHVRITFHFSFLSVMITLNINVLLRSENMVTSLHGRIRNMSSRMIGQVVNKPTVYQG